MTALTRSLDALRRSVWAPLGSFKTVYASPF